MSWSINEVAQMAGVSSRTLRHYQAIGLLEPESVEFNGRRIYGQLELLRLQEILILRGLGMPLAEIADLLDGEAEERATALADHLDSLRDERDRYERLIETVERTIEKGMHMTPEQIFEGLRENPYEEEARERWGDDAVDESNERLANLTPADIDRFQNGLPEVHRRIEALHEAGAAVTDPRVEETVREHLEIVSLAWAPNRDQYRALGRMYVEDERFRRNIGNGNDEMVAYLAEAMSAFADSPSFPG